MVNLPLKKKNQLSFSLYTSSDMFLSWRHDFALEFKTTNVILQNIAYKCYVYIEFTCRFCTNSSLSYWNYFLLNNDHAYFFHVLFLFLFFTSNVSASVWTNMIIQNLKLQIVLPCRRPRYQNIICLLGKKKKSCIGVTRPTLKIPPTRGGFPRNFRKNLRNCHKKS